jgi:hypothetical protein
MDIFKLIEQTSVAAWVREADLSFPLLECVHVAAVMMVFGSICMVDLRLTGAFFRSVRVTTLSRSVLPWTWAAFAVAAASGAVLMTGQASGYALNLQFQIKMGLMLAAGANMVGFHLGLWRGVEGWDDSPRPPTAVRLTGALSLGLWVGVILAGRWVGWTLGA